MVAELRRGVSDFVVAHALIAFLFSLPLFAQTPATPMISAGRKIFESRCSVCHGADGNEGELGPPIAIGLRPKTING